MNPGLVVWLRAFLIAFNLISLFILGNPFGLLELLLDYPAQDEEEMNRNLTKLFLIILPSVIFICYFISLIYQKSHTSASNFRRFSEPAVWIVLVFGFLTALISSGFKEPSQLKPLCFIAVVLIAYSGVLQSVRALWLRTRSLPSP